MAPASPLAHWTTTITADELAAAIDHCVVVDCRHDLFDLEAGRRAYAAGHLPGAHFLHQDDDLAGPTDGRNGRHPLPAPDTLAERLRAIGLNRDQQLVGYDDQGGMLASRLWWLVRWIGHDRVAVLDGGIGAWKRAGFPLTDSVPTPPQGDFEPRAAIGQPVLTDAVVASTSRVPRAGAPAKDSAHAGERSGDAGGREGGDASALLLLDARIPERFAGEIEPLDPVAGHIPGSLNWPFQRNLRPDGRFKPAEALRDEYAKLLGETPPKAVVHYCGSGITACHNLLAMEHAGMKGSRLYAGSWSEWCADPARAISVGAKP